MRIKKKTESEKRAFISYSHADKREVDQVVLSLLESGCRVWMDNGSIAPGSAWRDSIAEGIVASECVIAFISQSYMDSENCRVELGYALDKKKRIICILLQDHVRLSGGLEMYLLHNQAILRSEFETLDGLAQRILSALPASVIEAPEEDVSTATRQRMSAGRRAIGIREPEPEPDAPKGPNLQKVNRRRKWKIFKRRAMAILGIAAVLAAALGIYTGVRAVRKKLYKIDLTEYVAEPVFEGLNGHGRLTGELVLDRERLKEDFDRGIALQKWDEDHPAPEYDAVFTGVSLSADASEELSNGDVCTISIDYDAEMLEELCGIRFTGKELEVVVEGLQEYVSSDPFAGVSLVLGGIAPNASLEFRFPEDNLTGGKDYRWTVNGEAVSSPVDIGDIISIELTSDGQAAWDEAGMTPSRTKTEYTVQEGDVESYIRNAEDLSSEALDSLAAEAQSLVEAETATWSVTPTIQQTAVWLLTPKADYIHDEVPFLVYLYRTQHRDADGLPVIRYLSVSTSGLWKAASSDGVISLEENPGTESGGLAPKAEAGSDTSYTSGIAYSLKDFSRSAAADSREELFNSQVGRYKDRYQVEELK